MNTIRGKLFLLFGIFSISLVAGGILLNALFLERYYVYKNESIFTQTSQKIGEVYRDNPQMLLEFINLIDRVEGINCTLADRNRIAKFNSFPQNKGPDAERLPAEIESLVVENETTLLTQFVYAVVEKPNEQVPKLVFIKRLDDGSLIILKKSMKGIRESVAIANQFYMIAGLIIILIGGVAIVFLSKKITKPIIEMSEVAEDISKLDFTKRVSQGASDEIGSLGRSINKISETLNDSLGALQQDVKRRKQLVRNLSHELKTPIGIIKGYAEGLKYGIVDDPKKTQKYLDVISDECDRMDQMIRELLNLCMLESGMFELKQTRFDLGEIIRRCAEQFELSLSEKEIALTISSPTDLFITADQEQIKRLISNYMTNAIRHCAGRKVIQVTADKKGSVIRVSVFNSGQPITDIDIENIWDVFYKGDASKSVAYKEHEQGHGLGLSIVKLIAELHGATVGVENKEDGVMFYLEMPLSF